MKNFRKICKVVSVLTVLWVLMGCSSSTNRQASSVITGNGSGSGSGAGSGSGSGSSGSGGDSSDPNNPSTPGVVERNGTMGVRNFRQLSGALGSVTGVANNNAVVIAQLAATQGSLSVDGDAMKVNSATLLKGMELAAVFCREAFINTALRPRVYGTTNLAVNSGDATLPDSALQAVASSVLNAFIPDSSVDPSLTDKVKVLVDTMNLIQGGANTAAVTQLMAISACTTVASSQGFLFLN